MRRHRAARCVCDTERGAPSSTSCILKVPVIGTGAPQGRGRALHAHLGTLLSSGVPILDALEIVAKTAGNIVVEDAIMYAREKISEGKNMASR